MCHNRFTIQIDLFKYKRFKDGGCAYKNTESRHLKVARTYLCGVGYVFESRFSAGMM